MMQTRERCIVFYCETICPLETTRHLVRAHSLSSTFPTRSPTLSHAAVGSKPKDSRQSKAPIELLAPGSFDGLLFQSLPSAQNNKPVFSLTAIYTSYFFFLPFLPFLALPSLRTSLYSAVSLMPAPLILKTLTCEQTSRVSRKSTAASSPKML